MVKYLDINEAPHSIRSKWYCHDFRGTERIVLFGSGFGGHKDNKAAERFAETVLSKYKRTAVVTFDWPCHGDDVKKKLSLEDCTTYIAVILRYIEKQFGRIEICVYATSFGGFVFLKYLHENGNPFRKLALRAPAVNLYDSLTTVIMKPEEHERMRKYREVPVGFDRKVPVSEKFLEELRQSDIREMDFLDYADDILILQGMRDEVIPPEEVLRFAENNVIECVTVERADHRFQDYALMGDAIRTICEFFYRS